MIFLPEKGHIFSFYFNFFKFLYFLISEDKPERTMHIVNNLLCLLLQLQDVTNDVNLSDTSVYLCNVNSISCKKTFKSIDSLLALIAF